jgi:hypothetical protein
MWNRAGQVTYDNMAHAHCKLDVLGYKHTLKICNTYFFSTATMVAHKRPNVAFYHLFYFNACTECIIYYFHNNRQMHNYITKVNITTVSLYSLSSYMSGHFRVIIRGPQLQIATVRNTVRKLRCFSSSLYKFFDCSC